MERDRTLTVRITGDWEVEVTGAEAHPRRLRVEPPELRPVHGERYPGLPLYDPAAPGWVKGERLLGLRTQETTARHLLDPDSLQVASAPTGGTVYVPGHDFAADLEWGTFGRLPGGRIAEGQPVYVHYRHGVSRLDTIVVEAGGPAAVIQGQSQLATPRPPALPAGACPVGNVWLPGRLLRLGEENLFPLVAEPAGQPQASAPAALARHLPNLVSKLTGGGRLRILAWGDSVTDGGYLPDPPTQRWQAQFCRRLEERFPGLQVELVTEAWPGRSTASYLGEPAGSSHSYPDKVLAVRPDLIISEFVNDAGLSPEDLQRQYAGFLADFQAAGAEWILLTPHYVRPDWMDLEREKEIDDDPRPYVKFLRAFAREHPQGLALADAARKWGRLWRQGIPYTTLLSNSINHPDPDGMKLFADCLIELLGG